MSESLFIDFNTRLLIITGIFAIIILLMYIAFYKQSLPPDGGKNQSKTKR